MSQKTHPIGFRLGVHRKGGITSNTRYGFKDLHGHSSIWAVGNSGNVHNYGNNNQRDNRIKRRIESLREEDGYLMNKIVIHRAASYTGIFVDAYELLEPIHNYQIPQGTTEVESLQVEENTQFEENEDDNQENNFPTQLVEQYISKYREGGKPVHIQFSVRDTSDLNNSSNQLVKKGGDIVQTIQLLRLKHIPCCNIIAKVLAYKMSQGGRHERETVRRVMKVMKPIQEEGDTTEYGVKGYLVMFKGRIGGSERSRIIRHRGGSLPRHTVSAGIDYGFAEVNSASGKYSVTVRAHFKGDN